MHWSSTSPPPTRPRPRHDGLGLCYENGNGVEKDWEKASDYYLQAAEQGFAPPRPIWRCVISTASAWRRTKAGHRVAGEGHRAEVRPGLQHHGCLYRDGNGVEEDPEEAVRYFRLAMEEKYAPRRAHLGLCYEVGTGVEKDESQALIYYRQAAEMDYAPRHVQPGLLLSDRHRHGGGL